MSTITEAYVAQPPSPPTLKKIKYPTPLAPHEVLVDIAAASICHSDLRAAAGTFLLPPPLILGHEGAGRVRAVGPEVTYVQPGDAVVLAFASCMKCRWCRKGQNPYCDEMFRLNFSGRRDDGSAVATVVEDEEDGNKEGERNVEVGGFFFGQSSMARIALAREESCVKIGHVGEADLRLCATLGCGIQTGAGTIMNVVQPPPGSNLAIFGGGAVGLAALLAAQLTSPACIVLVDTSQTKLDNIRAMSILGPNTHLYNPSGKSNEEVAAELNKYTPDEHGMDFALDCVGNENIIKTAHLALDNRGMLVTIGAGVASNVAGFNLEEHLVKGITHRGTHQGDSVPRQMIPRLFEMYKEGQFPFDKFVTAFGFEEMDRALDEMKNGRVVKPLLVV
ncbi:GroES-like protein [Cryphonectria parasitica EP155]|uniref:GroES-like protein n=1 Tax=Cryphonectria parasitica (strain ATCC 38755 / EP155) TaxID=660469 RepID=A0A9P4YA34_CRYP1|nr:GroES-like protein [Cryphonectria parasitica EP155]KAF3769271.1 GroES-like protein [Cryphonectria parasitica EP155]